jgi:hypothetical protein
MPLRRTLCSGAALLVPYGLGCSPSDGGTAGTSRDAQVADVVAERLSSPDADAAIDATGDASRDVESASDAAVDRSDGPQCAIQSFGPASAGVAHSAGFSGSDSAFFGLYAVPCIGVAECVAACVSGGGNMSSCSGSQCLAPIPDSSTSQCLPPAYWLDTAAALSGSGTTANAAYLSLVDASYHDALLLTSFGASVPDGAIIQGVQFDVDRNADAGLATDYAVQVLRNGAPAGVDRSQTGSWPRALSRTTYGSPNDTWGVALRPADVRSAGFGISIAPRYLGTAGNDRAHIDSVRLTVYYSTTCD